MLEASLTKSVDELQQINALNQKNLKQNLSPEEKQSQGFVTWLYPVELLQKMNNLAPSVLIKDGDAVVAYALATLREAAIFHVDLQVMFANLQQVKYRDRLLMEYNFYCIGQICVEKNYRGKGLVQKLYQKHKDVYSNKYELLITEVSTANYRSLRAHEKIGFETIWRHKDEMDEWNVVAWNWK